MNYKPVKYIASCGCVLLEEDTIRRKKAPRICRKHKEPVTRAIKECMDCTELISPIRHRCEKHRDIHATKKRKEQNAKYENKIKTKKQKIIDQRTRPKKWKMNFRGDYCSKLKTCKKLNCKICTKFGGIFRHHDPAKLEQFTL